MIKEETERGRGLEDKPKVTLPSNVQEQVTGSNVQEGGREGR
jgi:hypothetical protein